MTRNNTATLHSRAWYGDEERTLEFPDGWRVAMLEPAKTPALPAKAIRAAFDHPIGTARIAELARGKRDAAIVVDDLSRPTPAATVLPYVLRELEEAGVPRDGIRFVVGGGSHRPLTQEEVVKKVGADVAANYEVTSHNFLNGDCRGLGNLPDGMPVYINRVVADAAFKLCVGGIYPHPNAGFGGGSKLIVPGVSGAATMWHFHLCHASRGHAVIEGRDDVLDHRHVSEEAARLLGLDAIVNIVVNHRREAAGVFVGDFVAAQRAGARFALKVYGTEMPEDIRQSADVVVTNCYPLDADPIQIGKALWMRKYFEHAYTVALDPATDGMGYHGLFQQRDFGRYMKQREAEAPVEPPPPVLDGPGRLLVLSEHFSVHEFTRQRPDDVLFRDWDTLITMLAGRVPRDALVAVFPFGGVQIPSPGNIS